MANMKIRVLSAIHAFPELAIGHPFDCWNFQVDGMLVWPAGSVNEKTDRLSAFAEKLLNWSVRLYNM